MTLFLVQHGEAKPETEDPERSLTERGTETVERINLRRAVLRPHEHGCRSPRKRRLRRPRNPDSSAGVRDHMSGAAGYWIWSWEVHDSYKRMPIFVAWASSQM